MFWVWTYAYLLVLMEVGLFQGSVNTVDEFSDTQRGFYEQMVNLYYNICSTNRMCNDSKNVNVPTVNEETGYENNTKQTKPCCLSCSCLKDSCFDYGSCCPDILSNEYKKDNNLLNLGCVIPGLRKHFGGEGVFMINSCPITFRNDNIRRSCQSQTRNISLKDAAPVSRLSDNTTYSNIYCALCNNVEKTDIIPWMPTGLECFGGSLFVTSEEHLMESIWDTECNVVYAEPPGVYVKECVKLSAISQCNVTGTWKDYDRFVDTACSSMTSFFISEHHKTIYGNAFCYMCNEVLEIDNNCITDLPNFLFTSFSAILNFAADDVENKLADVDSFPQNCSDGFVYDEYQSKCLEIHCFFGQRFYNGSCQEGYMKGIQGPYYAVNLKITPQFMITELKVMELGKLLSFNLPSIVIPPALFNDTYVCQDLRLFHETDSLNESIVHHFLYETIIGTYDGPSISIDVVKNIINLDGVERTTLIGNESKTFNLNIYTMRDNKNETKNVTEIQIETKYDVCGAKYLHQPVVLELKKAMICPFIKLNTLDLPLTTTGSGIHISELDLYIEEKYLINSAADGTVMVCLDSYIPKANEIAALKKKRKSKRSVVSPAGYVTFGCVLLSLVCLGLTLLTYALFPELRTTPGIYNMILSSALIIAQCMFQFGIGAKEDVPHWVCAVLGMLTHFTWLFVIFWMNVCSIHMARVFRNKSKDRIGKKSTVLYLLYALSMSSVLLILNNVISYIESGGKSHGYGDNKNCYISSQLMLGITFGLPVSVVVITNLFLFTFTVCQVSSVENVSTANQQDRNLFLIYARLSTVTGITWVFGFIYTVTYIAVFEYLFAVLNAGQGVFIMLAFVANRRVLGMYKSLCTSPKN